MYVTDCPTHAYIHMDTPTTWKWCAYTYVYIYIYPYATYIDMCILDVHASCVASCQICSAYIIHLYIYIYIIYTRTGLLQLCESVAQLTRWTNYKTTRHRHLSYLHLTASCFTSLAQIEKGRWGAGGAQRMWQATSFRAIVCYSPWLVPAGIDLKQCLFGLASRHVYSVCVPPCLRGCEAACMRACLSPCVRPCMCGCVGVRGCAGVRACMRVWLCLCVCVCVCVCPWVRFIVFARVRHRLQAHVQVGKRIEDCKRFFRPGRGHNQRSKMKLQDRITPHV